MSDKEHMPKEMSEAILGVMQEFGSLKKTEKNLHANYMFAPVDDFYDRISKLLPKFNLVIIASEIESELMPMTVTVTDKTGKPVGEKTTIWIKTKWHFKLSHNGVTYDDGLYRYAMVPTSGPQTEGIAQSYASKNFMRDTFKVATGEYELDDMAPVEHGVPTEEKRTPVAVSNAPVIKEPEKVEVKQDSQSISRKLYDKIVMEGQDLVGLMEISSKIDIYITRSEITKPQYEMLQKVLHARKMIIGTHTFEQIERSRESIDAVTETLRKPLDTLLKAREAEISATVINLRDSKGMTSED